LRSCKCILSEKRFLASVRAGRACKALRWEMWEEYTFLLHLPGPSKSRPMFVSEKWFNCHSQLIFQKAPDNAELFTARMGTTWIGAFSA
jgi:hypothetical protein